MIRGVRVCLDVYKMWLIVVTRKGSSFSTLN